MNFPTETAEILIRIALDLLRSQTTALNDLPEKIGRVEKEIFSLCAAVRDQEKGWGNERNR